MTARHELTFRASDGHTYTVDAVAYYPYIRKDGSYRIYWRDADGDWNCTDVVEYSGRVKDEYRQRPDYNRGKAEILRNIPVGESVRLARLSYGDERGWRSMASYQYRYGRIFYVHADKVNNEMVITRQR